MSLESFQAALALLVSDPDLVEQARAGDIRWLDSLDLTALERARLEHMANDERMAVMCSLYRSNRLTALVRTVPEVVEALGDRLSETCTDFWRSHPRKDMQFLSEGTAFCHFVRDRFAVDGDLSSIATRAERSLASRYQLI